MKNGNLQQYWKNQMNLEIAFCRLIMEEISGKTEVMKAKQKANHENWDRWRSCKMRQKICLFTVARPSLNFLTLNSKSGVFSSQKKYGPEKILYFDTFHAVKKSQEFSKIIRYNKFLYLSTKKSEIFIFCAI